MKNVTFIGAGYVGLVSGAGISDFLDTKLLAMIFQLKKLGL